MVAERFHCLINYIYIYMAWSYLLADFHCDNLPLMVWRDAPSIDQHFLKWTLFYFFLLDNISGNVCLIYLSFSYSFICLIKIRNAYELNLKWCQHYNLHPQVTHSTSLSRQVEFEANTKDVIPLFSITYVIAIAFSILSCLRYVHLNS